MTCFLCRLVLLLPALAVAQADPLPPIPTPAADVIRAETAYQAFLRSSAARQHGNDLAVIPIHTKVDVRGMTLDTGHVLGGFWYAVRAYPRDANGMILPPVDGWMHSTVIHLEADQLAALSARASIPGMPAATTGAGVPDRQAQTPAVAPPTVTRAT